jgi:hypothetical protein
MTRVYGLMALLLFNFSLFAQLVDTTKAGVFRLGGGLDAYYALNLRDVKSNNIPYFVSSARNNEFNINLAYLDFTFESEHIKFRFAPGVGTYMNANYAAEPGLLKIPLEAKGAVRLSKKKAVWMEFGVLGSPYTNENPFSREQLMYSRSLAPEYVPYYMCGVRVSSQLTDKLKLSAFVINGWQQIRDVNDGKSLGTTLEYKTGKQSTLFWNTYVGSERSSQHTDFRNRYFTDVYWVFQGTSKWSFSSCVYLGSQQRQLTTLVSQLWWQANAMARYSLGKWGAISARAEYFHDPYGIQIQPITTANGFKSFGYSLGYSIPIESNAMIRFEMKDLVSNGKGLFYDKNNVAIKSMPLLFANLTVWF